MATHDMEAKQMNFLFIASFITAATPAVFLGVNNGLTVLGVLLMAFSGYKIVTARR